MLRVILCFILFFLTFHESGKEDRFWYEIWEGFWFFGQCEVLIDGHTGRSYLQKPNIGIGMDIGHLPKSWKQCQLLQMKKPRALLIKKERYPFSFDILQQLLDIINLWNVRQGNIGYNRLVSHHLSLYCHRPERLLLLASVCFKGLRWVTSSILWRNLRLLQLCCTFCLASALNLSPGSHFIKAQTSVSIWSSLSFQFLCNNLHGDFIFWAPFLFL